MWLIKIHFITIHTINVYILYSFYHCLCANLQYNSNNHVHYCYYNTFSHVAFNSRSGQYRHTTLLLFNRNRCCHSIHLPTSSTYPMLLHVLGIPKECYTICNRQ